MDQVQDGDEPSIVFSYVSQDGDEGYPGKLEMTVTYTLTADDGLAMEYRAVSDQETPFKMCIRDRLFRGSIW